MRRLTHLGRDTDLRLAGIRWMVGLVLAGVVVGLFVAGDRTPVVAAVETGATVFLAWALARELDPDRPATALVAAPVAGGATVMSEATTLVGLAALLVAARITVRSTGRIPLLTDIVAVGVFVGVFARDPITWTAGLAVAAAVALDASLPAPAPSRHLWLAAAIGVAVTLTVVLSDALPSRWMPPSPLGLVLAAGGVVAGLAARTLPLVSTADSGGALLEPVRLRTARWMVTVSVLLALLVGGATVDEKTWPIWVVILVVGAASRTGTT